MKFTEKLYLKIQRIQSIVNEWLKKTPKQKWDLIIYSAEMVGEITGIRTHLGEKNLWYSWITTLEIIVCYFLIFYTILYNFHRNKYIRIIENCTSLGILTHVSCYTSLLQLRDC